MGKQNSVNIWISTFQQLQEKDLRKDYGHVWSLTFQYNLVDKLTPEQKKDGWKILKMNSSGRYVCSLCSNIWKSGLIQLLFHYRSVNSKRGLVLLLLQCPQCKSTNMEKTTIEEDKIHDFLMSLITTIRKKIYKNNIQPTTLKPPKCKAVPSLPPKEKEGEKNINVWISTFQHLQEKELRKNYNCVWNINFQYDLVDKLTPEQQKNDWKILKRNSFGRYVCSLCSNIWKSGLIQLLFHYRSVNSKRGLVLLQICREQCPQCKSTNMEKPTLEEDKIHEILMSLITAIRKNCYKNNIQPTTLKPPKPKAVPLPPKGKGKQKSQNVWMKTFHFLKEKELGADYGDVWSLNFKYDLMGKPTPEQKSEGSWIFTQNSFGSFICSNCSNKWKSGLITLIFQFCLKSKRGLVLLRIFRQQCRRCKYPNLEKPTIEENEVKDSLMRLIIKIRKCCYNEKMTSNPQTRGPAITKPHESNLCEACLFGICPKSQ
ncbi:uncharacterized protein LOC128656388 [Bombina bombina]|uniref:uncharacterized protein LOC128656388 n=1 Tax=Bombina bombina TaxID=8345 RepID=UPI00235B2594|nr:uncharacterized protein LOC128656388 [Bombina bombina]